MTAAGAVEGLAPLAMVAAMARNRVIGDHGRLPWHEPEDLRHFRQVTLDHAVIMGRKTFDTMGRPLPRRRNIVISRQAALTIPGCDVVTSFEQALALARTGDGEPRVIGGGEIYALALPLATVIHLTELPWDATGDAYFPVLDPGRWEVQERRSQGNLAFLTLIRRRIDP